MNTEQYTKLAMRTKGDLNVKDNLINGCLGLTGEAGEVVDMVKKYLYQGHRLTVAEVKDELSDTLWYLTLIADTLGITLSDIMEHNVSKLEKRYPMGYFRSEDSVNREEYKHGN